MHALNETTLRIRLGLLVLLAGRTRDERGDVPGWVMVTVMTAMLVVIIGQLASDELSSLLTAALRSVTG